MNHLLNESQTKALVSRCVSTYKMYKDENFGHLREDAYKAGMIDFCDNIIVVSSALTYDVSTIRNLIEDALDEVDSESDDALEFNASQVAPLPDQWDGDLIEETDYLEEDDE